MKTTESLNLAQAYIQGMIWATLGGSIVSDNAIEWQVNAVKTYVAKPKEEAIAPSTLSPEEMANLKRLWEQWIDEWSRRAGRG